MGRALFLCPGGPELFFPPLCGTIKTVENPLLSRRRKGARHGTTGRFYQKTPPLAGRAVLRAGGGLCPLLGGLHPPSGGQGPERIQDRPRRICGKAGPVSRRPRRRPCAGPARRRRGDPLRRAADVRHRRAGGSGGLPGGAGERRWPDPHRLRRRHDHAAGRRFCGCHLHLARHAGKGERLPAARHLRPRHRRR